MHGRGTGIKNIPAPVKAANRQSLLDLEIRNESFLQQQSSESLTLDRQLVAICTASALLSLYLENKGKVANNAFWTRAHTISFLFGLFGLLIAVSGALYDIFKKHEVEYINPLEIGVQLDHFSHEKALLRILVSLIKINQHNSELQTKRTRWIRYCYIAYAIGLFFTAVAIIIIS